MEHRLFSSEAYKALGQKACFLPLVLYSYYSVFGSRSRTVPSLE